MVVLSLVDRTNIEENNEFHFRQSEREIPLESQAKVAVGYMNLKVKVEVWTEDIIGKSSGSR